MTNANAIPAASGVRDRLPPPAAGAAGLDAVLLLGPTASGKSALTLQLAAQVPLEIVSIDSAQVYRGMDIGTAKPTPAERARVPHHLLDLREPDEPYSAADFVRDAVQAIGAIKARGRLPLVVGGTMLYAKALREGLSDLPPADAAVRAAIEARARRAGWPAVHAELARLDPATAARLAPADSQRIQRALEVIELTGQPLSALQSAPTRPQLLLHTIALLPADRAELHRRIEARFDAMLAAGFVDEVRAVADRLQARGAFEPTLPALRSVGYRQALAHLAGQTSVTQLRAAGIAATRQLAKRQLTWLRSMRDAQVIDPFAPEAVDRVCAQLAG